MNIIGISAYYHDSAAAIVCDGEIIAAAQEERFTRVKHDSAFPSMAVDFCLEKSGLSISDIDYLVFYDKPLLKFDRILETYATYAPRGFSSFSKAIPLWLKQKLFTKREIKKNLGRDFKGKIAFTEHHESHAAAAFYPSPFEDAAILTMDGVGEWATATIAKGSANSLEIVKELRFPHSLGLLYSAFTYYCGFRVNSGEYKLMGLAPYGKPVYVELIKEKIVKIYDDGSIWMDMSYFNFCAGLTMTSAKFHKLFGADARESESGIGQREMDIAASIQVVTEEVMLKMANHAKEVTGCTNLCLSGGVALNCVGNGKIQAAKIFENIWIQPAAGDAGSALGAALFVWYNLMKKERSAKEGDSMQGSYLGKSFSNDEIKAFLDDSECSYERYDDEQFFSHAAKALADKKVIGWFQGPMEFGPRALGGRSIIGDARCPEMQSKMNLKIKYRESFRPFAPSILAEESENNFALACESPYMLLVAPVNEDKKIDLTDEQAEIMDNDPDLCKRVNVPRSALPSITHIDYSARVQTVTEERNGRYYKLIKKFHEQTGSPVIINTSFNIRGEPIVCTPEDAYRCFMNTEMDVLVLESFILFKDKQDLSQTDNEHYKATFKLD
jgi:carbamoyltransferase